jgi:hypothetical protein
MPFQPGQSGNPAGRPTGSRNKVNRAMEPSFNANGEAVIERVVEHAKAANPVAMRLCMERLVPMGRHRPVELQLPPMEKPEDVLPAVSEIHRALGDGEITIAEAADLLRVVEITARVLVVAAPAETALVDRLSKCEQALVHVARFAGFAGLDSDSPLPPQDADTSARAAEEEAIVNNNAETMAAADAAPAEQVNAPSDDGAAVASNNLETMAYIARTGGSGNPARGHEIAGVRDEEVEHLRVASG